MIRSLRFGLEQKSINLQTHCQRARSRLKPPVTWSKELPVLKKVSEAAAKTSTKGRQRCTCDERKGGGEKQFAVDVEMTFGPRKSVTTAKGIQLSILSILRC
jgi:hypothetical protein